MLVFVKVNYAIFEIVSAMSNADSRIEFFQLVSGCLCIHFPINMQLHYVDRVLVYFSSLLLCGYVLVVFAFHEARV
jgi:hypothetical protein